MSLVSLLFWLRKAHFSPTFVEGIKITKGKLKTIITQDFPSTRQKATQPAPTWDPNWVADWRYVCLLFPLILSCCACDYENTGEAS
jgi:hypothetical protein